MREIVIAGAGTGSLTQEVRDAISRAECVCASQRFMTLIPTGKRFIPLTNFAEAFAKIEREPGQVIILVSGDPGLYSLLPLVKKHFPRESITVLPGVSSLQVLCARVRESWSDAVIISAHGRTLNFGRFLNTVERNRLVALFCDGVNSPRCVCEKLAGLHGVDVVIGENLGSESESVLTGRPMDFVKHDSPALSLMLVRNDSPFVPVNVHLRDSEFLRAEGVVMTHEAVRSVILGRMNLRKDSVLWDIGAGTGSISVAAGLQFPECEIHAVERKSEAVRVIARNAELFRLHNIYIHEGRALDVMESLPEPSHVFIGGSDGELAGILSRLKGKSARVVTACVTLDTLAAAYTILKDWHNFEALQVSITTSKLLTNESILMTPKCPVTILSATCE